MIEEIVSYEPERQSRRTKKANRNNTNNSNTQTRKANNSQPDYMRNCPKKNLKDQSLTEQERQKMCLRFQEEKNIQTKKIKRKLTPEQYCPKIKTQKSCKMMAKCDFINGKCTKKILRTNNTSGKTTRKRAPQKCKKCAQRGIDVLRKGHKCPYK